MRDWWFRLRSIIRRKSVESEMDTELQFHRERQLEKYRNSGLNPAEAERRLRLEFGGMEQLRDDCRDARGISLFDTLAQDLRYGWRTLLRSPVFAITALLTLALGIGANAAIFSVVYAVLLRPLPFHDPTRLILIHETTPQVGTVSVSYPNFLDWRVQSHTFSEMSAVINLDLNLSGVERPENLSGLAVSTNFLSMAGIRPAIGRGFTAEEEKAGAAPVILVSYALWQSHFHGDASVLGQTVRLNKRTYTIVGVLPPGFRWMEKCDVMEPVGVWATNNSNTSERGSRGDMVVVGRLAAGIPIEQATSEMEQIARRLAREYPQENGRCGVSLATLRETFSGDLRPVMLVLLSAAIFVLLVACANVANLFLMRGAVRSREMALRMAIGASHSRVVRQFLTESVLVAVLGGIAGVALAAAGIPAIAHLLPADTIAGASVDLNPAVLLFSAALVIMSTFVFGLIPALHSAGGDMHTELKEGGKTTGGRGHNRWRDVLASSEVAMAVILTVGAGLMAKSIHRLLAVDSGIRAERVLKLEMSLRTAQYDRDDAVIRFWRDALDRVRALPGVDAAAAGTSIPLTDNHSRTDISIEGMQPLESASYPHPDTHTVTAGYEQALGIRLVRGRGFTDADREAAPPVAMVNAMVAQKLFPGVDPIGKRFAFGRLGNSDGHKWITIVGVLADTKMYGLANPARLEVYVPLLQRPQNEMALLVKSSGNPDGLVSAIRAVISSLDREQPVFGVATMQQVMNDSILTRRVTLIVLGLFSGLALLLASIGIYGVVSYSVAQRSREIGIRLALGARPADVFRLVLAQGGKISVAGILVGTVASYWLTRLLTKLLYSVSAFDPSTLVIVSAGLALVALLACYIPARRALGVDPLIALRQD